MHREWWWLWWLWRLWWLWWLADLVEAALRRVELDLPGRPHLLRRAVVCHAPRLIELDAVRRRDILQRCQPTATAVAAATRGATISQLPNMCAGRGARGVAAVGAVTDLVLAHGTGLLLGGPARRALELARQLALARRQLVQLRALLRELLLRLLAPALRARELELHLMSGGEMMS
eukprot:COSAG01_NODE_7510_length_3175_cov_7.716607_2_plen_176_part_00